MDEPLIKTAYEKLRLINTFHERFAIREASIPGFATIDGQDLKQELETKGFASLLDDGVERIQYNDSILKDNPNIWERIIRRMLSSIISTIFLCFFQYCPPSTN